MGLSLIQLSIAMIAAQMPTRRHGELFEVDKSSGAKQMEPEESPLPGKTLCKKSRSYLDWRLFTKRSHRFSTAIEQLEAHRKALGVPQFAGLLFDHTSHC
jgi:hypothetical protein